ncbi:MAG: hypothetical protein IKO41_03725 [Lachnospiraceae bacterium]|nr:hypothetical protein [Lachnospiraceae bacterium]
MGEVKNPGVGVIPAPLVFAVPKGNEDLSPEESFDEFERLNGVGPYAPDADDDDC